MVLFLYTKLAGPLPFTVNSITTTKTDVFSVNGEGVVNITPDSASVTVGVVANGTTVKLAQDQLNEKINAVSEGVKKLGIEAKYIQTTNYNINPTADYTGSTQRITGYQASTNLLIKINDIEKVNSVIDSATASGANQVHGVTFEVSDKVKAQDEAREKAVAEAKAKAENAAKVAGFSLGKIINYNENFGDSRPLYYGLNAASGAPKGDVVQTVVQPGSSEIKVNVTLSYEIK